MRTKDERKLGEAPKFDKERAERLLSYREGESICFSLSTLTLRSESIAARGSSRFTLLGDDL
jgi:hypothetical protein